MKKNYFLLALCLMLSIFTGTAMAESITDVYGKYTFTATMTPTQGQDVSKLSDNCDVTIGKDAGNIYLGYIDGIAGSTKGGHAISNYSNGVLNIRNMNDANTGNFDGAIFFSVISYSDKTKGYNPFGGVEMPDWNLTVGEDGTITIPDFCIVSVSNYSDSLATIVATFTNAKLTLNEKEQTDIVDVSGSYKYAHGAGTYDYNQNSTFSPDYEFTLTKTDETNKNYTAEFAFDQSYKATLAATFDGVTVKIPFDSIYFGEKKDSIRLGNLNNRASGEISYSYVKEGVLSAYNGFSIVRDSISEELKDSTFQWFINGTAKDETKQKGDEVDFIGTYTVVSQYMDMSDPAYATKDDTFTITVAKDDYGYYVSAWGEYTEILYGGLSAKVDADNPSKLLITPNYLKYVSTSEEEAAGTYKYITLTDMNGAYNDIALTKKADGTFSLDQFALVNAIQGSSEVSYIRYYNNITSVTKNAEPQPGPSVTVAGTYKFTGNYCTTDDLTGKEKSFTIKIEENTSGYGSKYMVTEFDGTGIASANYGGASLTVSDETTFPITCTLVAGTLQGEAADCDFEKGIYHYNALYDMNGSTDGNAVTITLNQDGTCEITDFSIYIYDYGTFAKSTIVGWYSDSKLVRDNGDTPKPTPLPVTVVGTYRYTGNYCTMDDTKGTSKSFAIKIEENTSGYGSKYLVTEFDGTGIYTSNYGGASLTVSDEATFPITCTLSAGTLLGEAADCDFKAGIYHYNALYDINGSDENAAVTITMKEDGTCEIADFSIYVYDYGTYAKSNIVGWYSNGTLSRVVEGDANGDNMVDIADVNAVLSTMNGTVTYDGADVNFDGTVDIADVNAVLSVMSK